MIESKVVIKLIHKRDIIGLSKALQNRKEPRLRREAAEALGSMADARAVEPLIAALNDTWEPVRKTAAESLSKIDSHWRTAGATKKFIQRFIAGLKDKDVSVRRGAADALGVIGDASALEPLIAALIDGTVHETVVEALSKIDPYWFTSEVGKKSVLTLVAALKGGDWRVRGPAAKTLGIVGDAQAVEPLIAALKGDSLLRKAAAEALGRIGDRRAIEPLIFALKDTEGYVREAAAKALGMIGDPRAVGALIAALEEESIYNSGDIPEAAAEALGRIGDVRAVEPLITALKQKSGLAWKASLEALSIIGDVRAVEPLIKAFKHKDIYYFSEEKWVVESLERIGTPAVEALIHALHEQDTDIRLGATKTLGLISDTRAVEPLVAVLKDEAGIVRSRAAEALGLIGDTHAVEPLVVALKDQDLVVRLKAVEALSKMRAVEPLVAALKNKADIVRSRAAKALGLIGDGRAVKPLVAILEDRDASVRDVAANALVSFGWQPANDTERAFFILSYPDYTRQHDRFNQLAALGAISMPVLTLLLREEYFNSAITDEQILASDPDPRDDYNSAIADTLTKILEHDVFNASSKDLEKIAILKDLIRPIEDAYSLIDCSHIRQLAREELARREAT